MNLLDVLAEYILHWMVKNGSERSIKKEEVLLKEGGKNQTLYIVLDGLFGVYGSRPESKPFELHAARHVIGEDPVFSDGFVASTVVAEEPALIPRALSRPGSYFPIA